MQQGSTNFLLSALQIKYPAAEILDILETLDIVALAVHSAFQASWYIPVDAGDRDSAGLRTV